MYWSRGAYAFDSELQRVRHCSSVSPSRRGQGVIVLKSTTLLSADRYRMSNATYVLNIQNPPVEGVGRGNSIPVPRGTTDLHINPWSHCESLAATSAVNVTVTDPDSMVTGTTGRGVRSMSSQSGWSVNCGDMAMISVGFGVACATAVGDGVASGNSGVAVGSAPGVDVEGGVGVSVPGVPSGSAADPPSTHATAIKPAMKTTVNSTRLGSRVQQSGGNISPSMLEQPEAAGGVNLVG